MSDRSTVEDVDSIRRLTTAGRARVAELPEAFLDLARKRPVAHLSSAGPHGEPQAHPVWFDVADGRLLISTGSDRQKYRNIRRDHVVSQRYLQLDTYPYAERRGVERVILHIRPDHVVCG